MTQAAVDVAKVDAGKPTQQLFGERMKRTMDAIQMKQPDRIPLFLGFGNGLADLAGCTRKEMYDDADKQNKAMVDAAQRFLPDCIATYPFGPEMSRVLGDKMTKWPGFGLEDNESYQFHEQEYMKADEYDEFINDLGDWTLRKYLPRTNENLAGLAMLPQLGLLSGGFYGITANAAKFAIPPVASALETLVKAGQARMAWIQRLQASCKYLVEHGFPPSPLGGPLVHAPFDFMSNTLRGMKGIFMDIRRCPDKLLAAEERILKMEVSNSIAGCKAFGGKSIMMFLHRGSDGFISIKDFEKFYWPQLKTQIEMICEAGITPFVFWEGTWDKRLEYLTELPKGKVVGAFQTSDIFKVKEVLGDSMCIVGGMKFSMLCGGATASEIRDYTKKLCKEVGKGGGYMMASDIFETEGAKPELLQAWCDATREFGQY